MHVAQPVKAEPNCDKAGFGVNKGGNAKGNSKCLFDNSLGDGKNPEPNRDCSVQGDFHKNGLKIMMETITLHASIEGNRTITNYVNT